MKRIILTLTTIGITLTLLYNTVSETPSTTEPTELGRQMVITLPDDRTMYTYETYIVRDGDKVMYKGERNEFDITGSKIEYREWGDDSDD